jgi:hypothetical protein
MGISDIVSKLVDRFMEKPHDPLTGRQAIALCSVRMEGLASYPDSKSIREGLHPTAVYFFFQGNYIGTAYGSRFISACDAEKPVPTALPKIIRMIESAYLKQEQMSDG